MAFKPIELLCFNLEETSVHSKALKIQGLEMCFEYVQLLWGRTMAICVACCCCLGRLGNTRSMHCPWAVIDFPWMPMNNHFVFQGVVYLLKLLFELVISSSVDQ